MNLYTLPLPSVTMLPLLLLCLLARQIHAATISNKVIGEPKVECAAQTISVAFDTDKDFEGSVYVKGFYDDQTCKTGATFSTNAKIEIPMTSCDIRRQRQTNPRGLYLSVTVIITFHPMFITMVDRAYNVQCFYMEADKEVTAEITVSMANHQYQQVLVLMGGTDGELRQLTGNIRNISSKGDLSQLTTEVITQNVPMPVCTYQVLADDAQGTPVRFASVGDTVYHQWQCQSQLAPEESGIFCMTVHSCFVDNGQGKKVQLLDEQGCPIDDTILGALEYASDMTAGKSTMVFKFADQPSLYFQCQIRLSLKEGDACERPSDNCNMLGRGKRSADGNDGGNDIPGAEVDVFSESITVFDIDSPLAHNPSVAEEAESSRQSDLSRRLQQLRPRLARLVPGGVSGQLCMSPVVFGLLMAVLVTVLIACLAAVAVLCARHNRISAESAKHIM